MISIRLRANTKARQDLSQEQQFSNIKILYNIAPHSNMTDFYLKNIFCAGFKWKELFCTKKDLFTSEWEILCTDWTCVTLPM